EDLELLPQRSERARRRAAPEAREQDRPDGVDAPRHVHEVLAERVQGLPQRVPLQGPRALPAGGSQSRRVANVRPPAGVAKLVIRARLKIGCPLAGRAGSTPAPGIPGA